MVEHGCEQAPEQWTHDPAWAGAALLKFTNASEINILAALLSTDSGGKAFMKKESRAHMQASEAADPEHARILDYWMRRRHGLTAEEWHDFYQVAVPVLMRFNVPGPFRAAHRRRELVDLFFTEKILLNAATTKAGPLKSPFALATYLWRFALSLMREDENTISTEDLPEEAWHGDAMEESAARETASYTAVLAQARVDVEEARRSANRFIGDLDDGEFGYLRHNTCVEDEEQEPISRIAQRLAIGTTFHFKAKKLGITRSKGETYKGYEKTKIGGWLLDVFNEGRKSKEACTFSLHPDWCEEIAALLVLLCQQVRMQYREAA